MAAVLKKALCVFMAAVLTVTLLPVLPSESTSTTAYADEASTSANMKSSNISSSDSDPSNPSSPSSDTPSSGYASISLSEASDLSVPSSISVSLVASGVEVTWDKVDDATSYQVLRKTGSGDWQKLGDTTTNSYTDTTVSSGVTYTYTVQAINGSAESSYDNEGVSIYVLATPKLTKADHTSASAVQITWNSVTGASSYKVYRKVSGGSWSLIKTTTSTTYTDSSLSNGKQYYYSIQAISSENIESAFDDDGTSVRKLANPSLKSAENASGGIKVTWSSVSGADGYYVYRKTSGGSWTRIGSTTSTSYTDKSSLKNGTKYYYTVRAYEGEFKNRSYYNKSGVSELRISTPTLKSAENASGGVKVTWKKVSGATKYYVYRKTSGGSWKKIKTTTSTSYTDSASLKSGTKYIYTVRAVKGSDKSYYDTSGITVTRLSIPSLKSAANASGGIKVTWGKVTGAKKYYVYRKTSGGSWKRIATTTSTSYTDSASLKSGTKYIYTVRAVNGSDKSYYKKSGISETKLSIPTLKSAENASGGIKVTWKKVSGAKKYYVYRKTSGGSWKRIATTTSTSYTDSASLKGGTKYIYTVRAVKGSDKSYYNKTGVSETKLAIPSLKSAKKTSSGIKVSWGKVTGATGYYVYRKSSGGSWKRIATTSSTSYTDTSTTSTSYIYTVRAYKGSDKSYYNKTGVSANDSMTNKAQSYSSKTKYLILVDRGNHKVGVYKGKKNNWSLQYSWSCVTGASSSPTIKGTYSTTGFKRTRLTTDSRARWCTQIWGGYFFHSILASESELGKSLSHGCIRLPLSAAKWMYNNIKVGTTVVLYN